MKIYREVGSLYIVNRKDNEGYERPVYEIEVDEAEPIRHGKWEYDVKTAGYKCSECGKRIWSMSLEIAGINYCPNCGADMRETE